MQPVRACGLRGGSPRLRRAAPGDRHDDGDGQGGSCFAGFEITNSEVGNGRFTITPWRYRRPVRAHQTGVESIDQSAVGRVFSAGTWERSQSKESVTSRRSSP
jgi:hypothetical protein